MLRVLLTTYGAVFLAEIVGDKLLYTTGALATRYRSAPVLVGMTAAFMVKMGAAVTWGRGLMLLPPVPLAIIASASLLGVAVALLRRPLAEDSASDVERSKRPVLVAFAAILTSEWGDPGQIMAAAMAAQSGAPIVVWLGASAAVVTKGVLATTFGAAIRRWLAERVSLRVVRYGGVAVILLLCVLSILETLGKVRM